MKIKECVYVCMYVCNTEENRIESMTGASVLWEYMQSDSLGRGRVTDEGAN